MLLIVVTAEPLRASRRQCLAHSGAALAVRAARFATPTRAPTTFFLAPLFPNTEIV
jgi:hypothetical protein